LQLHVFAIALQGNGARFGHKYFDSAVFVLVSLSDLETVTTIAVRDVALATLSHDYLNATVKVETVACLGRHVAYPQIDETFRATYRTVRHFFLPPAELSGDNV
tara:strand:+ start:207 stop:518 length:312 start_codon:yes stop_codon:yes gene_type:complete